MYYRFGATYYVDTRSGKTVSAKSKILALEKLKNRCEASRLEPPTINDVEEWEYKKVYNLQGNDIIDLKELKNETDK